ncbi:MAG: 1,2-phenylacetyl-CoA epoxidase subunit PaaD [Myxococcota bacterium]
MHAGSPTERAYAVVARVCDPELPFLSVVDLGILRGLDVDDDGAVHVRLTPTYSGCPATETIERDVTDALTAAGFDRVHLVQELSPPWTTDAITEAGRIAMQRHGIAPPGGDANRFFEAPAVRCPRCGATETHCVSRFGSTACKALYACDRCLEPFDHFRCR